MSGAGSKSKRRQEVLALKEKGLTQSQIAKRLGVSQVRIFWLLNPEKQALYNKRYRNTEKGKKAYLAGCAVYRARNSYELKLVRHLGVSMSEARKMVDEMEEYPE